MALPAAFFALRGEMPRPEIERPFRIKTTRTPESFSRYEAMATFNLTYEPDSVQWNQAVEPPQWLFESFSRTRSVLLYEHRDGQGAARLLINLILLAALEDHSGRLEKEKSMLLTKPVPLRLAVEEKIEKDVRIHRQDVTIRGEMPYAIRYEDEATDKSGIGLVILQTQRDYVGPAIGHLIVYMGIIHQERIERRKVHAHVWGCASDGNDFYFCRIDNSGRFSASRTMMFEGDDRSKIFGIFCGILRILTLMSPQTSPIHHDICDGKLGWHLYRYESARHFDYDVTQFFRFL